MSRRFLPLLVAPLFAAPLFAVTAHAGTKTLVSAPIMHETGGVACTISNGGPKPITVNQITLSGTVNQGQMLDEPFTLATGQFLGRFVDDTTFGFCSFDVVGSTKGVRAATCRWDGDPAGFGTSYDCVEAH